MLKQDRPWAEDELAPTLVVDAHAEHVAREEVAGELDGARSPPTDLASARASVVLPTPGTALDEQVAACEVARSNQGELHCLVLAFQGGFNRLSQRLERR